MLPDIQDIPLYNIVVTIPALFLEDQVIDAASLYDEDAVSVSWERLQGGGWVLQWILPFMPDDAPFQNMLADIFGNKTALALTMSPVPQVNWLAESYKQFPPFYVGSFFIYGSHYEGEIPAGCHPLLIDAATAFGSGEHGTTKGCLEALDYLQKTEGFSPSTILDMGAGSGILGIAAWRLWQQPVLAVDIDREATRVACRHRTINNIPSGVSGMVCATGDGYRARRVAPSSLKFDLIIANILAGPLVMMAPDLAGKIAPSGYTVLSGLLCEQEADVLKAHTSVGLTLVHRIVHGDWATLILRSCV